MKEHIVHKRMTVEDIKRLNYIRYTSFRHAVKSPCPLWMCYLHFFTNLLGAFIVGKYRLKPIDKKILVLAPSLNNKMSLRTIYDHLNNEDYKLCFRNRDYLPYARVYLRSIRYLPLFYKLYRGSSYEDKKLIRYYYKYFMSACGCYEVIGEILDRSYMLNLIILSNDHILENRCIIEQTQRCGIRTLYVQHASVTDNFPPLHFTYSFLDGLESYKKYETIGDIQGYVFLSGSPRFDAISNNNFEKIYDVGIAINMVDNLEKVLDLCLFLRDNFSRNIIVRPHPRMKIDRTIFEKKRIVVSDSKLESSFLFLSKVKVLIANESSIHLDAALMSVPSILFKFSNKEIFDWYSYVKNGLISVLTSKDEVLSNLKNGIVLPKKQIQLYNAAYHTPYEGKVGEIIANFVNIELRNKSEGIEYLSRIMRYNGQFFEYNAV